MSLLVKIQKQFSGFSLNVEFETEGGCMGILGASGCGKSMTLKCVAGILKPDKGRIVHNKKILFDSDLGINLPVRKRKVGYLFQNYALFPTMTVEENLKIAVFGKEKEKRTQVAEQILRFQLEGLRHHFPSQLSGGQQQRVALARMLLTRPDMILLDEPFSALDGYLKDSLQIAMLEQLREFSGEVLFVSHSRDEIFRFCDQMTVISGGKTVKTGETKEIFQNPQVAEAAKLTGCKNLSAMERISDYELFAKDWNIKLKTEKKIQKAIGYVGIRGHHLLPWDSPDGENIMRIQVSKTSDTPFHRQILFQNAEAESSKRIWWIQEKKSMKRTYLEYIPLYIKFPKEDIMLLS